MTFAPPTALLLPFRRMSSRFRFYRRRKHFADLCLASAYLWDIASLYITQPNDEIAYYNMLFSVTLALMPRTILELGTGPGLSSRAFIRVLQYESQRADAPAGVLHSCDLDAHSLRRLHRYGKWLVAHVMSTSELAQRWSRWQTPIDLLYIDADHSHEQSLADFVSFAPFVVPNGIVIMHDTFPRKEADEDPHASGTVWKTAQYIKAHFCAEYECMTIPRLSGVTLLRKRGERYF